MAQNIELADAFEAAIIDDYNKWRKTLPPGDRSVRYRGMITRCGAVGMAQRLLASSDNRSKGNYGFEDFVIDPKFQELFTVVERAEARDRLNRKP